MISGSLNGHTHENEDFPWRRVGKDEKLTYIPRCSYCGNYRSDLYDHWFFSGLYCGPCITEVLFMNCQTIQEANSCKRKIRRK